MATDIFASSPQMSARQRFAALLLQQAADTGPVKHPLQAVARALAGGMGGHINFQAEQEDRATGEEMFKSLPGLGAGGSTMPSIAPQPSAPGGSSPYSGAISSIESGGRYDTLGPVTRKGDRAYGKYQVMGTNVGPWTREVLGREMSPQEFLRDPDAQEAVFNAKFGSYVQKHGPEGAARAWFAGEGGMNDMGRSDQLGTTVAAYANKFTRALGPQMASLAPSGLQNAQPAAPQPTGVQVAQAQPSAAPPSRASVQIPPEVQQTIRQLGANPRTRQQAWQLYLQYAKPSDQFEEIRDSGGRVIGQRSRLTGEKKADPTRPDYQIQKQDDGSFVAVNKNDPQDFYVVAPPGGGKALIQHKADEAAAIAKAKGEAEKQVGAGKREAEQKQVANIVVQDVDRAIALVDESPMTTTGVAGPFLSKIGGTRANDVRALVDTVKANAGFAELQKMRDNSPTGGALGQVSEREIAYLQSTIGNLEQSQTADQFKDNLRRVKNAYLDIIHGSGNGPREKLNFQEKKPGGKTKSGIEWSVQ